MALERYEAASPGDPNPYDSMGNMFDSMGKHEEAEVYYKKALAVNPNWSISSNTLAGGRAGMEDYKGAFQWLDTSFVRAKDFGSRLEVQYFRAGYYFWLGQLNEADRYFAKCNALFADAGQSPDHAWDWLKIWIDYERRQFARCRRTLDLWGAEYVRRDFRGGERNIRELFIELCRGFISAKEGNADSVTASLARMESIRARIPASDTGKAAKALDRSYRRCSNLLRSEWLLSTGRAQEALAARMKTGPGAYTSRERGPIAGVENWNYPNWGAMVDILPRAYLALGQLDSAIAAYERAIRPGEIFPRYHYRLAQVYEQKGLKAQAVAEYEKFLKIFGKADPIYKEPADARAKLAKLKGKR
jgi:tetratricopeptide (TPR) repeat protein